MRPTIQLYACLVFLKLLSKNFELELLFRCIFTLSKLKTLRCKKLFVYIKTKVFAINS